MNGKEQQQLVFWTDVTSFTKIKIITPTFTKDEKTFIEGPNNGNFSPSLLPPADYYKGHNTANFEVMLVDDFGNQYTKEL